METSVCFSDHLMAACIHLNCYVLRCSEHFSCMLFVNKVQSINQTSIAVPLSSSGAHRCTLEFITEAVQELYAKGQLRIKPYAGYLKGKRIQTHTQDSLL